MEIVGKTRTKVTLLFCAIDSMEGHFPHSTPNKRLGTLFSDAFRDKDADITWLYGPWKRSASFGPSASFSRPGQSTCIQSSIRARSPRQNKLGTTFRQGILLAPEPVLSHRLMKRKV